MRSDMRMERILIAYDGLSPFDDVLEDLRWAGLPDQAEAMVVSVADVVMPSLPPGSMGNFEAAYPERLPAVAVMARERALRTVEEARKRAVEAGDLIHARFPAWRVRAESSSGSPAWELLRKAEEWGADLIVVGPPGQLGTSRFTLGSVSKMVVAEATCAERWGADCIFVGARGLSRGDRFLVGGVSSALAARARCSVEVVRTARSSQ